MVALVVVLVLVALVMAGMWWVDRKWKLRLGARSAEEELRDAERSLDHDRWSGGL